ncbi:DNA adenine methylase [Peribacillus simplex]|uniref:DNA adenine methylase n=1 Tax=Peribacillus simplex TaxID=1478 RepID=UPI003671A611
MKVSFKDFAKKLTISQETLQNYIKQYNELLGVRIVNDQLIYDKNTLKYCKVIKKNQAAEKSVMEIKKALLKERLKQNLIEYKIKHNVDNENVSSPLRFPGSKSKVISRFVPYFEKSHLEYREPFFGGGSIFFGKAKSEYNLLNDIDENIHAFFLCVRDQPEELCNLVRENYPTLQLWREKKEIDRYENILEKGFDFLFFNRTNYSGIYKANPLGGMNQDSDYPIDCRWNPDALCESILACSDKLQGVELTNSGFEETILRPGENVLMIIDPPYYHKGNSLYPISMSHKDHLRLAELLRETNHKYLLTIDDCTETREIYLHENCYVNQESWYYTVNSNQSGKLGKELFISNFEV